MALTRPLTLDEFLRQPIPRPDLEFERGRIWQKQLGGARHGVVAMQLAIHFEMAGGPRAVARAFPETRVSGRSEDVCYVPDVIAYRVERVPSAADGYLVDELFVVPDVAVEIPSPEQDLEQLERCRWYVAHGVKAALLAHPGRKAIWVLRADAEIGPLTGDTVVDLSDVFEGFSFVVSDLFRALRARPS